MQTHYCVQPQDGKKLKWSLFVPPIQDRGLLLRVNNVKFLQKLICFLCVYEALRNVWTCRDRHWGNIRSDEFLSQCRNSWPPVCTTALVAQHVFKGRSLSFISMISCTSIQNNCIFETSLNMSRDIGASLECLLLPDFSHSFFFSLPLIFKRLSFYVNFYGWLF